MRSFFMALSASKAMGRLFARFPPARRVARRFIAGESLEDALAVATTLNAEGKEATLNYLGEKVTCPEDARQVVTAYEKIMQQMHGSGLKATISVKPTHLGLGLDEALFEANLGALLGTADPLGIDVEVDMEDSGTTGETLRIIHALLLKHKRLRVALQASLHRTAEDLMALAELGGSARLVKGAYDEPETVAWKSKREVDQSYSRLIGASLSRQALDAGFYPAFGTHDHRLIEEIISAAADQGIGKDRFEFQMLLGIRRDWQDKLKNQGFKVRIYVPFGSQWYPYFMRRLAERPANVLFMIRALFSR
ncbi:MAG: proline dehydrogenase family protein [Planctomycetota bacterium]